MAFWRDHPAANGLGIGGRLPDLATMQEHERLHTWQMANRLAIAIHSWTDSNWSPARSAVLDQLRRSSLSVPLNIAEGVAMGPGGRCKYHIQIAYGSAVETAATLRFMLDLGDKVRPLCNDAQRCQWLVHRLWKATSG